VARNGSFKVSHIKNVELTGPYFHNGGMITLRQIIDFYSRGGDFPITNADDRDVLMLNFNAFPAGENLTEDDKDALVDFMLAMTDLRVKNESAPFDRPEVFVPLDGTAPDNTAGRPGFLALLAGPNPMFRQVTEVGAAGHPGTPLPNFLGISSVRLANNGLNHFAGTIAPPVPPPPAASRDLVGTWGAVTKSCQTVLGKFSCNVKGPFTIKNQGTASAGASVLRVYFSPDTVLNIPGDTLLQQSQISVINAGKSVVINVNVTVKSSVTGRSLFGVVDATKVVVEGAAGEANNTVRKGL
jgi:hypothetical protein